MTYASVPVSSKEQSKRVGGSEKPGVKSVKNLGYQAAHSKGRGR